MAGRPARHMVHGEWMTVREAAVRLGRTYKAIENWRTVHRREDGKRALLVDYWDWAMRVRRGEIPRRPGKHARTYWVHGRQMTIKQAAQRAGVSDKALHSMSIIARLSAALWDRIFTIICNEGQEALRGLVYRIIISRTDGEAP